MTGAGDNTSSGRVGCWRRIVGHRVAQPLGTQAAPLGRLVDEDQGELRIVTGAGNGIGQAVAVELAERGIGAVGLVDHNENVLRVARMINDRMDDSVAEALIGDTTDADFRRRAFDLMCAKYGVPNICVPAAAVNHDQLAVKIDPATGKAVIYPIETFRTLVEVNLIAPVYWAMEMVARIAEKRKTHGLDRWTSEEEIQGTTILIGSISSQGIPGQVAYAATKAALEGRGRHTLQGSHVPWSSLRGHPSRLHGYADGPRARGRLYRKEHPPLYPVEAFDRAERDRRRHLFHDLQFGCQRRALGGCRLAPQGLKVSDSDRSVTSRGRRPRDGTGRS